MKTFDQIRMESQNHPQLTLDSPFQIISEYGPGPMSELKGDVHYALQISIVLAGKTEVSYGNWSHVFQENELWWTMCWEPHAFRFLARRNLILSININIDNLGNVGPCSDADFLAPFTVKPEKRFMPETPAEHAQIRELGRELFTLDKNHPRFWRTKAWLLIHKLILQASDKVAESPDTDKFIKADMNRVQKAVSLVRSTSIPPSLPDAAAACSLSVSRFSVLFSKVMGVSYGQFALRVRLSNAAGQVKSGLYTLNEIAEKFGFCDASSFCNAFRKVYRCTPNEFRKR